MRHGIVSIMLAIVYRKQGTYHPVDGMRWAGSAKRWLSRDGQVSLERSHTRRAPAVRGAPYSDMPRVIGMIPAGMAVAGRGGAGIFFDGHTGGAVQSRRRGWGSPCGSAGASRRRTGPRGLACPPKDGPAVSCNEIRVWAKLREPDFLLPGVLLRREQRPGQIAGWRPQAGGCPFRLVSTQAVVRNLPKQRRAVYEAERSVPGKARQRSERKTSCPRLRRNLSEVIRWL